MPVISYNSGIYDIIYRQMKGEQRIFEQTEKSNAR